MSQIEAGRKTEDSGIRGQLEAERKKLITEKEKEKELEPLLTEYIPV